MYWRALRHTRHHSKTSLVRLPNWREIVSTILMARGFGFFKDGWAVFDFIVIAVIVDASNNEAVQSSCR